MENLIITILGLIIISIGVIEIYDARTISKKIFSSSDENSSVKILRIGGFILSLIGILLIYCR